MYKKSLCIHVLVVVLSFVLFSGMAVAAPMPSSVSPTEGPTSGGDTVQVRGEAGFDQNGTTRVTFGGTDATSVSVIVDDVYGAGTITCVTPSHAAGLVDVVVINPDDSTGTLVDAYTYYAPPPSPEITAPNDGSDFTTKVSALTLGGTCGAGTNAIEVNGSATGVTYVAGQTTWSYDTTLVTQGANVFNVTAIDLAMHASAPDTITVTFDNIAPDAPVITAPNDGDDFLTRTAALTLSGTCAADTNAIEVNGSATGVTYVTGETTWSYDTTLTTQGANLFSVTAVDLATNVSAADAITVTFDSIAPDAPVITAPHDGDDFTTNVEALALSGTCATDTNVIRVNGSATGVTYVAGQTTWSYDTTLTAQGANVFVVTAVDSALNVSAWDVITVTFDDVAPDAPVVTAPNSGADFATKASALTLSGTCAADTDAIEVNGAATGVTYVAGETTWSYDTTLSTQGANLFSVTAIDLATNTSLPDAITVTFDDVAPDAPVITAPNSGADFTTKASALTLSGTCATDTNAIEVNGSAVGVTYIAGQTAWSYDTTLSTQGANLFTVTAIDLATNVSTPDTITVTFDDVAPDAPVITAPNSGADFATKASALTLSGTCAADTNAIEVNGSAVGVTYIAGQTAWSYDTTLSTQGANLFAVTAIDLATNVSTPDTITVTLDDVAPDAPVITAPNGGADFMTNVAALTLSGTCAEDTNAIKVNGSTTGVTYVPGQTTWSYSATLSVQGANLFTVTAVDLALNVSAWDTITVTFDNVAPGAPAITAPNGGADFTTKVSALTLSGTCAADTRAIEVNGSTAGVTYVAGETAWSYATILATQGANLFTVTAIDLATNVSAPDTITIAFDSVPPDAPVITAPNSGSDFTTDVSALTLSGTCAADTNAIQMNGSATGVTYTPGALTWSYATTLAAQGPHPFSVTAIDLAANVSAADTITVTLDSIVPLPFAGLIGLGVLLGGLALAGAGASRRK